jgi:hypothetical protein
MQNGNQRTAGLRRPARWGPGHEPCACRLDDPRDLPRRHAEAMTAALGPGEELRCLLYSPIWEGRWAPFGLSAQPAAHAVAVTRERLLISRDTHAQGRPAQLRVIPLSNVLYLQLGSSFCLGWFSVEFAEEGTAARESILFEAVGRGRFAEAVRECRRAAAAAPAAGPALPDPAWQRDRLQAERVAELLLPGERPLAALRSSERWEERRWLFRRKWKCIAPEGLLLVTDGGILRVTRETYERPVRWNIGMNVVCMARQAVRSAVRADKDASGQRVRRLMLVLARQGVTTCQEASYDDDADGEADVLLDLLKPQAQGVGP